MSNNNNNSRLCKGFGECLKQMENLGYKEGIIKDDIICKHNCAPQKCPNYIFCGEELPFIILDCHGGLCLHCDMNFGTWKDGKGKLIVFDSEECPICLDIKDCVCLPFCSHHVCVDCLKKCYEFDEDSENEPEFPYSQEIQEEYEKMKEYGKWENDELINKYKEECNEWECKREIAHEEKKNLRCCPICRK